MTGVSVDVGTTTVSIDGVEYDMSVAAEAEMANIVMMDKLVTKLEILRGLR